MKVKPRSSDEIFDVNLGGGRGVKPLRRLPWFSFKVLWRFMFTGRKSDFLSPYFSEDLYRNSSTVRLNIRGQSHLGYENAIFFFSLFFRRIVLVFENLDSLELGFPLTFLFPVLSTVYRHLLEVYLLVKILLFGGDVLFVVESSIATPLIKSQILPIFYLFPRKKFLLLYPYPPVEKLPGMEAFPVFRGSSRFEKGFLGFFLKTFVFLSFSFRFKVLWARSFPPGFSLALYKFFFRKARTVFDIRGDWFYEQKKHFGVAGFKNHYPGPVYEFFKILHRFLLSSGSVIYVSRNMKKVLFRKFKLPLQNFPERINLKASDLISPPLVSFSRFCGVEPVGGEALSKITGSPLRTTSSASSRDESLRDNFLEDFIVVSGSRIPWEEVPHGLSRLIVFIYNIPYEILPAFLKGTPCFGGVFRTYPMRKYVFPVKVAEYLASGKILVLSEGMEAVVEYLEENFNKLRSRFIGEHFSVRAPWIEVKRCQDFLKFKRSLTEAECERIRRLAKLIAWRALSWENVGVRNYETFLERFLSG